MGGSGLRRIFPSFHWRAAFVLLQFSEQSLPSCWFVLTGPIISSNYNLIVCLAQIHLFFASHFTSKIPKACCKQTKTRKPLSYFVLSINYLIFTVFPNELLLSRVARCSLCICTPIKSTWRAPYPGRRCICVFNWNVHLSYDLHCITLTVRRSVWWSVCTKNNPACL